MHWGHFWTKGCYTCFTQFLLKTLGDGEGLKNKSVEFYFKQMYWCTNKFTLISMLNINLYWQLQTGFMRHFSLTNFAILFILLYHLKIVSIVICLKCLYSLLGSDKIIAYLLTPCCSVTLVLYRKMSIVATLFFNAVTYMDFTTWTTVFGVFIIFNWFVLSRSTLELSVMSHFSWNPVNYLCIWKVIFYSVALLVCP